MNSLFSRFFCCAVKTDGVSPFSSLTSDCTMAGSQTANLSQSSTSMTLLTSVSVDFIDSSAQPVQSASELGLRILDLDSSLQTTEATSCSTLSPSSLKITIFPSDSSLRREFSFGPSYLHYSNIVYEDPSVYEPSILSAHFSVAASVTSLANESDIKIDSLTKLCDYTQNYSDAIQSSRPASDVQSLGSTWPSSRFDDLTENDYFKNLQKARVDSIKLPPLPKSPKRSYRSDNTRNSTFTKYYSTYYIQKPQNLQ